jgi:hypothetical protein
MTSDTSADTSYDGRWLTYQELANIRHISKTSAIRLVMRHRWRRQRDNQGGVRILVPSDMLASDRSSHDAPDDASSDTSPAFEIALTAIEAAHAAEVAALRVQVDTSEQARIGMQAIADQALAQLANVSTRSDAEITTLRDAVEGLRGTVSRTEDRAAHAEQRAREAEAQIAGAEAEAAAKVERAEAAIASERGRADRAEDRADGLRRRVDELEVNLDAARVEARQATEAVTALTRDEVARKARGRWERLRAAWRGR